MWAWIALKKGWLPWIWISGALGTPMDDNVICFLYGSYIIYTYMCVYWYDIEIQLVSYVCKLSICAIIYEYTWINRMIYNILCTLYRWGTPWPGSKLVPAPNMWSITRLMPNRQAQSADKCRWYTDSTQYFYLYIIIYIWVWTYTFTYIHFMIYI